MLHSADSLQDTAAATASPLARSFFAKGWCRFAPDPQITAWVRHVRPHAVATTTAPEHAEWHRCGGTWFAGVNVLGNDGNGRVGDGGPPLQGQPIEFISQVLGLTAARDFNWDKGQVSVCYPGYPQPMDGETEAAFRYRSKRDAAHLDGVHPVGPERRRFLKEPHAFVLGVPLTNSSNTASPLVIWEGSHERIRTALRDRFADIPAESWGEEDITAAYQEVRRDVFETCPRVVIHASPGECYLVHRLALHGVSPWHEGAHADDDGRMIAYFRPEISAPDRSGNAHWLEAP